MIGYIYKTTCIITGMSYVGKCEKTIKGSQYYLGSGLYLKRAIKKYGKENFVKEVLEECDTKELLVEREIYWIDKLQTRINGYNIAAGGTGGNIVDTLPNSKEIRAKQRLGRRNRKSLKGTYKHTKPRSEEYRLKKTGPNPKISKALKGKKRSESNKENNRKVWQQRLPVTCPHCGLTSRSIKMKVLHFDNCKKKSNGM